MVGRPYPSVNVGEINTLDPHFVGKRVLLAVASGSEELSVLRQMARAYQS